MCLKEEIVFVPLIIEYDYYRKLNLLTSTMNEVISLALFSLPLYTLLISPVRQWALWLTLLMSVRALIKPLRHNLNTTHSMISLTVLRVWGSSLILPCITSTWKGSSLLGGVFSPREIFTLKLRGPKGEAVVGML